jgi:hypothetical protein
MTSQNELTILPGMQRWGKRPDMQATHVTRFEPEARDTTQNISENGLKIMIHN